MLSERIIDYLERHADRPFRSRHMEESLHFRFDYLTRCLKKQMGMTLLQYLRNIQFKRAKMLLETTELTVTEIGEHVGIEDQGYFNREFRQMIGMSAIQYRKQFRRSQ